MSGQRSRRLIVLLFAGLVLALHFPASHPSRAQPEEKTLRKGQTLTARLASVTVNVTSRELEGLIFEEPYAGPRWRGPGCRLKLAEHPILQQAFERGFLLRIQTEATSNCIRTYEIGRDESLLTPKAAGSIRTQKLIVTATGALAPRLPFTPVERFIETRLSVIGTGYLTRRAPFAPVNLRTDSLTLTGTGSR